MPIVEPAIRPPAEADSFLLQVTSGCSANTCTFCGAYLNKPFGVKNDSEIGNDIAIGARLTSDTRRVFLMDGDALILKNERLLPILEKLGQTFPKLSRIASYANDYNISGRNDHELQELYNHKLKLIYMGLESGNQGILTHCGKRSNVAGMIDAVRRAERVGIKSSVMVLLGLGGKKNTVDHVKDTITALNQMQPRYLSFLTLMLVPGTPLYLEAKQGLFLELSPIDLLKETYQIIAGLELEKTVFRSDHASNYLPLEGRFPSDKEKLLQMLEAAQNGNQKLRPEFLRGL